MSWVGAGRWGEEKAEGGSGALTPRSPRPGAYVHQQVGHTGVAQTTVTSHQEEDAGAPDLASLHLSRVLGLPKVLFPRVVLTKPRPPNVCSSGVNPPQARRREVQGPGAGRPCSLQNPEEASSRLCRLLGVAGSPRGSLACGRAAPVSGSSWHRHGWGGATLLLSSGATRDALSLVSRRRRRAVRAVRWADEDGPGHQGADLGGRGWALTPAALLNARCWNCPQATAVKLPGVHTRDRIVRNSLGHTELLRRGEMLQLRKEDEQRMPVPTPSTSCSFPPSPWERPHRQSAGGCQSQQAPRTPVKPRPEDPADPSRPHALLEAPDPRRGRAGRPGQTAGAHARGAWPWRPACTAQVVNRRGLLRSCAATPPRASWPVAGGTRALGGPGRPWAQAHRPGATETPPDSPAPTPNSPHSPAAFGFKQPWRGRGCKSPQQGCGPGAGAPPPQTSARHRHLGDCHMACHTAPSTRSRRALVTRQSTQGPKADRGGNHPPPPGCG